MRGQGARAGCGPSFFSSPHLHGELPSALEPQFPTQTGQMLLRGARGLAAQGRQGKTISRLSGSASIPPGLASSSSQQR